MKTTILLLMSLSLAIYKVNGQVVLNELYTDPGAGKHEFFELYNSNPGGAQSVDDLTLVTYFDIAGQKGFYVMDLPNMTVASRGFFVGSSALPFNYQGTNNSNASDFNWNSVAFAANNGYLRKWVQGGLNVLDGNLFYDQATVPAGFNDFFFRRTGTGASYTVFLYKAGVLVNTFIGGSGGGPSVINDILNMPALYVDMTSSATDFTITFSGYNNIPVEFCNQDAGSDNGYIREYDGACGFWKKSSATVQHTPKASNGSLSATTGAVSVSAVINPGTALTGSTLISNIVAAPSDYFSIEMQVFTDIGTSAGSLDASDVYVQSNIETKLSDGPFNTTFFPFNASILIVVKAAAGCFDKIMYIPNAIVLSSLIKFEGNKINDQVHLRWKVDHNENVEKFDIQKSKDGPSFQTVTTLNATTISGQESYNTSESAPDHGRDYYRLRIMNKNGTVYYSNIIAIDAGKNRLSLGNNPVRGILPLNYIATSPHPAEINIIDMNGGIIYRCSRQAIKGKNQFSITLPSTISSGSYFIQLFSGEEKIVLQFITL